jgi:hypothetical protein
VTKSLIDWIPKMHPKHITWVMPLILSGLMSGSISCFNMLLNKGYFEGFWQKWLMSWCISWMIAYPLIMIFMPIVRNFLIAISKKTSSPQE